MPDFISAAFRALSFVALLQAAGVSIFLALFPSAGDSNLAIRRLGRISAIVGLALALAHTALEASRMAGSIEGLWDWGLQHRVLTSSIAVATALRCAGLLLLYAAFRGDGASRQLIATTGAGLALFSFAVIGHTSVSPARWLLAPVLFGHLWIVAFWFGSLLPLLIVTRRESPVDASAIVECFSRIASWLVPGILVAGIVLALVLLPNLAALADSYGTLLLTKVAAFALLMILAAANKWRFGPAIQRGEPARIAIFRRMVAVEFGLIVGVLVVTAIMTSFFSPD